MASPGIRAADFDLEGILDTRHEFPVSEAAKAGLPENDPDAAKVSALAGTRYAVTLRRLLHAILSKATPLPAARTAAGSPEGSLFFHSVRWDAEVPCFQPELGDFQNDRCHELGVGVATLLVHDTLRIPWDQLEQIPGRRRRMDYRAQMGNLKLLLEAKGTCRRSQQAQHVRSGLAKKAAHRSRGEQFTLGLNCSTWMGTEEHRGTGIVVADPPRSEEPIFFGDSAAEAFRLQHYARICRLVGQPLLGRALLANSARILHSKRPLPVPDNAVLRAESLPLSGRKILGGWLPGDPLSFRLACTYGLPHVKFFFGLDAAVLDWLVAATGQAGVMPELLPAGVFECDTLGVRVSVFPDGSLMAVVLDTEPTIRDDIYWSAKMPAVPKGEQVSACMSEAETRRRIIDQRLALAGWHVGDLSEVRDLDGVLTELEVTSARQGTPSAAGGTGHADYALILQGRVAAVIEAKRASKDARLGREQATQYALAIQAKQGGEMPLVFYTNGYDIYFWEHGVYPPERVFGFPTHGDLLWMVERQRSRKPLSAEMISTSIVDRPYQLEAVRKVLEGSESKRKKFLLVQATGTGKTRVAVALIDVLRRARWAQRVLFLVDRRALAEQAEEAFKEHIPHEPRWVSEKEKTWHPNARLYVATYQTMLNLVNAADESSPRISPFFFDVVVADESHRTVYNVYRQVLDYFCAIRVGLTATPTQLIGHDTFALFNCAPGSPTFAYSYEQAIQNAPPYLAEFESLKIRSRFQVEGIKGKNLSAAARKKLVAEGRDPNALDYEGTDLERSVTNAGTNELIIREFWEGCIKDPTGTLPGKTIIFAMSKGHALRLEELFDKLYPEHAGTVARMIVSEDPRAYGEDGLLRQFKTRDMPRVAISVDMLDTGVDIREVVNLVFAKPVYSFTKFWQMIGRGTRLLDPAPEKRKKWCPEKDKFLIIDCWGNFEYWEMNPRGREPSDPQALPVKLFRERVERLAAALNAGAAQAVQRCRDALLADLNSLPPNNVVVLENVELLQTVRHEHWWSALNPRKLAHLRDRVAPILRARPAPDDRAIRFEMLVVRAAMSLLSNDRDEFESCRAVIVQQVSELPQNSNVVAKHQHLIVQVLDQKWWDAVDDEALDELASRLGPLMKLRKKGRPQIDVLNIQDQRERKERIVFGPQHESMPTATYRREVETAIHSLVDGNKVLQKIKAGLPVSDAEMKELARLLEQQRPHVTEELLRVVYDHKTARFQQFIRHIFGLERLPSWQESVARAFDEFIARHTTFTSMQIRFLMMLKTFVLQTGKVEKKHLVDAPFTQIHPDGIQGVFQPNQIEEIVEFARSQVG